MLDSWKAQRSASGKQTSIGDLDQYGQPESARLMHQDWFKPWEEQIEGVSESDLVRYAQFFYFGEGH